MDDEASGSQAGLEWDAAESRDSALRDVMGRWLPGSSGNLHGRPPLLAGVRELARQHTALAIAALASIAGDRGAPPGARILAARELLDRGHGRASPVELVQDLAQMSDDELEQLELEERAALDGSAEILDDEP